MDLIEKLFHVSPDGGNGVLEALYVVAFVIGAMLLFNGARLTFRKRAPASELKRS